MLDRSLNHVPSKPRVFAHTSKSFPLSLNWILTKGQRSTRNHYTISFCFRTFLRRSTLIHTAPTNPYNCVRSPSSIGFKLQDFRFHLSFRSRLFYFNSIMELHRLQLTHVTFGEVLARPERIFPGLLLSDSCHIIHRWEIRVRLSDRIAFVKLGKGWRIATSS